ncbi:heterokaryon incompatibility, partial [Setomelanomma holmii]
HTSPSYDTVSYVWGSNDSASCIECDGMSLPITHNLGDALRKLRDPMSVRSLWVDAICINQKDEVERASQVQLMGLIYWTARQVHVWLG